MAPNVPTETPSSLSPAQVMGQMVERRTYCAWLPEKNRRETWVEAVDRTVAYLKKQSAKCTPVGNPSIKPAVWQSIREAIKNKDILPSMRLLQFAGKAADRTQACIFNCAFIAPECLRDFAEVMYLLMCGCGVGFSVEQTTVEKFPAVAMQCPTSHRGTHVVPDTTEGWCDALLLGMKVWWEGGDIDFDFSQVREEGARLQTKGGRASGPGPLKDLLEFTRKVIIGAQGRTLASIEFHDILCMIGSVVVAGGVRRSAMISLSDLDDEAMAHAKTTGWFDRAPQRAAANNSAVYHEKPSYETLLKEMTTMYESGSGERGILNTKAPFNGSKCPRRAGFLRAGGIVFLGCNPCGEIYLQSHQFCNLTEVVGRPWDTLSTLQQKNVLATIVGTIQASMTDFGDYLSAKWSHVTRSEALLGVSLTGIQECPAMRDAISLRKLKLKAVETNIRYAAMLNINPATAVTCVKPSGTASIVAGCTSGIHAHHAPHYIRRVRMSASDMLTQYMMDNGVPWEPAVTYKNEDVDDDDSTYTTAVFSFPIKAPATAEVFSENRPAMDQLEDWLLVSTNYTEHNVSCTVTIGADELDPATKWILQNWDNVGGLAFLPRSDIQYVQAPYETISEERYTELLAEFPENFSFDDFASYETMDTTQRHAQLACSGGACAIFA